MGCSRSVTFLTGTISLTHLVCHSVASVYRLLINRAPECFMSRMVTCTEKPGSYWGKTIYIKCISYSNHITRVSVKQVFGKFWQQSFHTPYGMFIGQYFCQYYHIVEISIWTLQQYLNMNVHFIQDTTIVSLVVFVNPLPYLTILLTDIVVLVLIFNR